MGPGPHGARRGEAGRDVPHIAVFAYGSINDDEEQALEAARSIAAWFPQTAPGICDLAGLPRDLVTASGRGYSGGEFQEAVAAARVLPDEFVRKVALAGNRPARGRRIGAVLSAGANSVNVFPLGEGRMETGALRTCGRR